MALFEVAMVGELCRGLFEAVGAPAREAAIVSDHLVDASLRGIDSHGVIRVLHYLGEIEQGKLVPGAKAVVERESPTSALVNGQRNFGQVTAARMVELAAAKAKAVGMACVLSRGTHHIGRLGAHAEALARQGLIAMATCSSSAEGHWIVPWGGREGRLATNPIAWSAPTSGDPLVFDMSTSMIAEGKIRALMHAGQPLPPGCVLDGDGKPTRDPKAFYGPPRGTILPFGGDMGYKGFGLSLLTMVMGTALAGYEPQEADAFINGLSLVALDPALFGDAHHFITRMDHLCDYLRSSPPAEGFNSVILPGDMEYQTRRRRMIDGIPLADTTWEQIGQRARQLGVAVPTSAVGVS